MPITAPVPVLVTNQPVSGATATLEIAMAYDNSGVIVATPVLAQLPIAGEIGLTFAPNSTAYPTYVTSGLNAWDYSVKNGMSSATLSFKTAALGTDTVVGPLVKSGLLAGNGAVALFRLKQADGTYFSGTMVLSLVGAATPVRGIQEYTFSGMTSGQVVFTNS